MVLEEGVVVRVADIDRLRHTAQGISTVAWQVEVEERNLSSC